MIGLEGVSGCPVVYGLMDLVGGLTVNDRSAVVGDAAVSFFPGP
jgi:hypothetical protein